MQYSHNSICHSCWVITAKQITFLCYNSQLSTLFNMKSFLDYYLLCWRKAFNFKGKSTRAEYWSFFIVNIIINIALICIGSVTSLEVMYIAIIYSAVSAIPYVSATVRRIRDTGKSLWLLFLTLIPYVGQFVLLYFLIMPSNTKPD